MLSHNGTFVSPTTLLFQSSGALLKKKWETRISEPKDGKESCELLLSGCNMAATSMNSQCQGLPTQDLLHEMFRRLSPPTLHHKEPAHPSQKRNRKLVNGYVVERGVRFLSSVTTVKLLLIKSPTHSHTSSPN